MAVGELQPGLELDRVLGRRGELGGLGDVRLDVGAAVRRVHQERVDLVHHGERAVVVRAGRVDRGDLVGRADGEATALLDPRCCCCRRRRSAPEPWPQRPPAAMRRRLLEPDLIRYLVWITRAPRTPFPAHADALGQLEKSSPTVDRTLDPSCGGGGERCPASWRLSRPLLPACGGSTLRRSHASSHCLRQHSPSRSLPFRAQIIAVTAFAAGDIDAARAGGPALRGRTARGAPGGRNGAVSRARHC